IARPIFAPALVSFIGGDNWGVSLGFGPGIGWFPLGPREIYRPAYFVSERYIRGLNPGLADVYGINCVVNRAAPGAGAVVSREVFTSGRISATSRIRIEPRALAGAPIAGATAPVTPVRASLLARADRAGFVSRPPDIVRSRIVRTRIAPAPAAI